MHDTGSSADSAPSPHNLVRLEACEFDKDENFDR